MPGKKTPDANTMRAQAIVARVFALTASATYAGRPAQLADALSQALPIDHQKGFGLAGRATKRFDQASVRRIMPKTPAETIRCKRVGSAVHCRYGARMGPCTLEFLPDPDGDLVLRAVL